MTKTQEKKLYAAVAAADAHDDDDAQLLVVGGGLDDPDARTRAAFQVGENVDFNHYTVDDAEFDFE